MKQKSLNLYEWAVVFFVVALFLSLTFISVFQSNKEKFFLLNTREKIQKMNK